MAIHQIDRCVFLVEYPGLPRDREDVGSLAAVTEVSDREFGVALRRLLYTSMEHTRQALWVRERGYAVKLAPTEPHNGKLVFRITFMDEDEAMLFAMTFGEQHEACAADARPAKDSV
ncbi:hypothetical protein [Sphingosinicella sp. BN140058]|uniref:hypothetical protein n=1 Tax=Sphingosinicella sp. BN140058 TaxID=1892855 RepID=UPI0010133773|nr:hypothetical protein [Sphingosinicella sp. BN140058]QAY76410.1 hypothetical protein ETR14_07825 [Sphingosinicella sp. BN140058]